MSFTRTTILSAIGTLLLLNSCGDLELAKQQPSGTQGGDVTVAGRYSKPAAGNEQQAGTPSQGAYSNPVTAGAIGMGGDQVPSAGTSGGGDGNGGSGRSATVVAGRPNATGGDEGSFAGRSLVVPSGIGGAPSSGGSPNTGGAPSSGGSPNTGGAPSSGGSPNPGGSPNTGGSASVPSWVGLAGAGGVAGALGSSACQFQLGDVDGDGHLDKQDSDNISMFLLQGTALVHPEVADVDCNGRITDADVSCVWSIARGLFEAFRCDYSFGLGATPEGTPADPGLSCGLRLGDVDGNGIVDINDATRIAQFGGGNAVQPFFWVVADLKCDGKIDINDALMIERSLLGMTTLESCRTPAAPADSGGVGGTAGAPGVSGAGAGSAGAGGAGGAAGSFAAIASTGRAEATLDTLQLGDVNSDGTVDLLDADAVALFTVTSNELGIRSELGDVNCDGKTNLWDARAIADRVGCRSRGFSCE